MKNSTIFFLILIQFIASCNNTTTKKNNVKHFHRIPVAKIVVDSTITNPEETGELKMLITNHFNTYFIYKGEEKGLEYELLKLYAKAKGWKLKLEVMHDLDGFEDTLIKNKVHFAAATIGVPNQEINALSDPLYTTDEVIVRDKKTQSIDLIATEIEIPVVSNLPYMKSLLKSHQKHIKFIAAKKNTTKQMLVEKVAEGKLKYAICSRNEAEIMQIFYPNLIIDKVFDANFKVALYFHPKSKKLKQDFNDWLKKNRNKSDFQWTIQKYKNLPSEMAKAMHRQKPSVFDDAISDF